jgi:vancomycin resistance protein VanJ
MRLFFLKEKTVFCFEFVLFLISILGLAIHLTIRDRIDYISTFFYATPYPVLAVFAFLASGCAISVRKRNRFIVCVALGLLNFSLWIHDTYQIHKPVSVSSQFKVMFWNVARHQDGFNEVFKHVKDSQPDFMGMVEATRELSDSKKEWEEALPDVKIVRLSSQMLFLVRGQVLGGHPGELGNAGKYNVIDISVRGERLTVLLIDMKSNPLLSRRSGFEELYKVVESLADEPLIVMGDFNTPVDSALVEPLKAHLTHAFNSCGNGFSATWPVPFPVLSLDHIWFSRKLTPIHAELSSTWISDHRSVVVDFAKTK